MLKRLKRLINRGDERVINVIRKGALLIDVRTSREYAVDGIEGTINYPLDDLFVKMNQLNKNKSVIVFCRSGNRSRHAKFMLEENGFVHVEDAQTVEKMNKLLIKANENGKT
jgi:rhodanese-related sulfurtransferase